MRSLRILLGVIAVVGLAFAALAEDAAVVPSIEAGDLEAELGLDLDDASGDSESLEPAAAEAQAAESRQAASEPAPESDVDVAPTPVGEQSTAEAAPSEAETPATADAPGAVDEIAEVPSEEGAVEDSLEVTEEFALPAAADPAPSSRPAISLGPEGLDTQGRRGRIHTVTRGNTLWDISEAYLGTPWVWPSIWEDNRGIDNPHLINPGDRIWISSTLMRPISEEEAARFLAASEAAAEESPAAAEDESVEEEELALDEPEEEADSPMDQLSMGVQDEEPEVVTDGTLVLSWRERFGVLVDDISSISNSVVGGPSPRSQFAQGDDIYFTLPKEGVTVGDQYAIFRDAVRIRDPATHLFIGHYVESLGWGEVTAVGDDVATLRVERSITEMQVGDRVMPRKVPSPEVSLHSAPAGLEAQVAYIPNSREVVALYDHVYLNRGELHGLQDGMRLEIYLDGGYGHVLSERVKKRLPDRVIANLVVVDVEPNASVAVVTASTTEIEVGALVRARSAALASRY